MFIPVVQFKFQTTPSVNKNTFQVFGHSLEGPPGVNTKILNLREQEFLTLPSGTYTGKSAL